MITIYVFGEDSICWTVLSIWAMTVFFVEKNIFYFYSKLINVKCTEECGTVAMNDKISCMQNI